MTSIHVIATIQNIFACDRAISMFRELALLLIDQVVILGWNCFSTVFNFVYRAVACCRVKNNHIEFADGKLKDEDLLFRVCKFGSQQNDIFEHTV